jgi:transposase
MVYKESWGMGRRCFMLSQASGVALMEQDERVFAAVVPANHYLRQVAARVDFERFRPELADAYSPNRGRPAIDPVRMLKILFLRFHYRLSDRQVMERAGTDMAFRWFLGLGLHDAVPNHTSDTYFRQRIGVERFARVFQELVSQAREAGLVRDRLRLKDATHLLADVAELRPLALAAQVREHLLRAAEPFFPDWVERQRAASELLRQTTAEQSDAERLSARLEQLRTLAEQLREQAVSLPSAPWDTNRARLNKALEVAAKLLDDRDDPEVGDRLASAVDPEARTGLHGGYFVGYLLDLAMDADSEIITAVNVLPGNGAEAADALTLIRQEEAAQGNDVEGLSIDGAGYNGPVLRELTDPAGLNLDVTVPPPKPSQRATFAPERFTLQVLADGRSEVTCPAGQTTRQRERFDDKHASRYTFKASQCAGCPLREECLQKPQSKKGRTVIKNDYEAEHRRVHEKARTPAYEATRREHPKIERKLGEMARHHGARRACFRGIAKVLGQALLTAWVVNVKRIVKLLTPKIKPPAAALAVRAEWIGV